MHTDGIPLKLLLLIQGYYRTTRARVRVYGEETELFSVGTGVRQRCVLSPTLFNYAIDHILNTALKDYPGVEVGRGVMVTDFAYADDIVLLGANGVDVQGALEKVHAAAAAVGLLINTTKSKVMRSLVSTDDWQPISLGGVDLEDVEAFVYLGSAMVPTGQGTAEVERRIGVKHGLCRLSINDGWRSLTTTVSAASSVTDAWIECPSPVSVSAHTFSHCP